MLLKEWESDNHNENTELGQSNFPKVQYDLTVFSTPPHQKVIPTIEQVIQ